MRFLCKEANFHNEVQTIKRQRFVHYYENVLQMVLLKAFLQRKANALSHFVKFFQQLWWKFFFILFTEMFLLTLDYFDLLSKSFAYYFVQSPSWNFFDNINKLLYYSLGKLIQWKLFSKKNAFDGFGNEICRRNNSKWINAIVVWFGFVCKKKYIQLWCIVQQSVFIMVNSMRLMYFCSNLGQSWVYILWQLMNL